MDDLEADISHVACAVRGRLANRNAIDRAIQLAVQNDARLTFLLVMPSSFLDSAGPTMAPVRAIHARLKELGEYILSLLRDQAHQAGVREVRTEVRIGDVRENLRGFVQSVPADILVLGRPTGFEPQSVFTPEEFESFTHEIERVGPIAIEVVDPQAGGAA